MAAKVNDEQLGTADRAMVLLKLDRSKSVDGQPIRILNEALQKWISELRSHELASRLDIAIIAFGDNQASLLNLTGGTGEPAYEQAFVPVDKVQVPLLTAGGNTPLGQALEKGLAVIAARKAYLRNTLHLKYFRPIVWVVSDGRPTDTWEEAAEKLRRAESDGHVLTFAVGFGNADEGILGQIAPDATFMIDHVRLESMLRMASSSADALARGASAHEVKSQVKQDMKDIEDWLNQTGVAS